MDKPILDSIHQNILNNIDDTYQKTQGFPTYDLTRGISYGVEELENLAYETWLKLDIDNLTGDDLDNFIEQRTGQTRTKAVKAIGELTITEGVANVLVGDLFETATGVQFESTESKLVRTGDKLEIQAVVGGLSGNVATGAIDRMPVTIQGLISFTNEEPTHGGYDVETDNAFRQRYYELLRTPINGVNKNTYTVRAKEVDGVLGARVIPIWNGVNSVKVVIIGNDYKSADEELIKAVQDYIDPNKNGDGSGTAPIGAVTTVVGATPVTVAIEIKNLTIDDGYNLETVKDNIKTSIETYIKSTVFNTDEVLIPRITQAIMTVNGVHSFDNLTLNGGHVNITIGNEGCATLGDVTYD